MKSGYKESASDKEARKRERRIASANSAQAASEDAAGLTSDLRAIYGLRGMLGTRAPGSTPQATSKPAAGTSALGIPANTPSMLGVPKNLWDLVMAGAPK